MGLGKTNRVWGQQTAWGSRDPQLKGGDHHYQPTSIRPIDDHDDDDDNDDDDDDWRLQTRQSSQKMIATEYPLKSIFFLLLTMHILFWSGKFP